jgi:NADH-quinone oxidoreductase subunit I
MVAPPHEMVEGTTDTDYYQGKVTKATPEQFQEVEEKRQARS